MRRFVPVLVLALVTLTSGSSIARKEKAAKSGTAMALGKKLESDPTLFTVQDGATYLFSNADAKKMFHADAKATIVKADAAWKKAGRKQALP